MKKFFLLVLIFLFIINCKSDDNFQSSCVSASLPNYPFDTGGAINLNLPQYNQLQFAGNSLYVAGYGVKGFYLYNTGASIVAFEASDPAHAPSNCSFMVQSGIELTCSCDDGNVYELLTGQQLSGTTGNCLRNYRVEQIGSVVRVFN